MSHGDEKGRKKRHTKTTTTTMKAITLARNVTVVFIVVVEHASEKEREKGTEVSHKIGFCLCLVARKSEEEFFQCAFLFV
jgi:hypothetical protein